MMPISRRSYFIKKDFQSRFILRFAAGATLWIVATVSLLFLLMQRRIEDVLYSPHINIRTSIDLLMPSALQAHVYTFVLFTAILLFAVRALWKRLSPPLYSLKKDITRIAAGDLLSGVALGEDEEFQDLAAVLDRMRSDLRQRFIRIKDHAAGLSAAVEALDRAVLKGNPTIQLAAEIKKTVERMKEEVHGFRL
jgi:methyl-accepting chemotaxis protein